MENNKGGCRPPTVRQTVEMICRNRLVGPLHTHLRAVLLSSPLVIIFSHREHLNNSILGLEIIKEVLLLLANVGMAQIRCWEVEVEQQ